MEAELGGNNWGNNLCGVKKHFFSWMVCRNVLFYKVSRCNFVGTLKENIYEKIIWRNHVMICLMTVEMMASISVRCAASDRDHNIIGSDSVEVTHQNTRTHSNTTFPMEELTIPSTVTNGERPTR